MNPTQSTRFEVLKQHGHHYLRLSLPAGGPVLGAISCCAASWAHDATVAYVTRNVSLLYLRDPDG